MDEKTNEVKEEVVDSKAIEKKDKGFITNILNPDNVIKFVGGVVVGVAGAALYGMIRGLGERSSDDPDQAYES